MRMCARVNTRVHVCVCKYGESTLYGFLLTLLFILLIYECICFNFCFVGQLLSFLCAGDMKMRGASNRPIKSQLSIIT